MPEGLEATVGALGEGVKNLKDVCDKLANCQLETVKQLASFESVMEEVKDHGKIIQDHIIKMAQLEPIPAAVNDLVDDQKFIKRIWKGLALILGGDVATKVPDWVHKFIPTVGG